MMPMGSSEPANLRQRDKSTPSTVPQSHHQQLIRLFFWRQAPLYCQSFTFQPVVRGTWFVQLQKRSLPKETRPCAPGPTHQCNRPNASKSGCAAPPLPAGQNWTPRNGCNPATEQNACVCSNKSALKSSSGKPASWPARCRAPKTVPSSIVKWYKDICERPLVRASLSSETQASKDVSL